MTAPLCVISGLLADDRARLMPADHGPTTYEAACRRATYLRAQGVRAIVRRYVTGRADGAGPILAGAAGLGPVRGGR